MKKMKKETNKINPNDLREPAKPDSGLNRTYKDTVFRAIFNDKENALALYNALTGQNLPPDVEFRFTTLEDVIYKTKKNDVSFLLETAFIILLEHQSTLSDNMTIRDLIYYTTTIQRMFNNRRFYERSEVILPRPEFIMLYNGTEDVPDYFELKLSDNFAGEGDINLQLTVKVYNINEGRNPEIMKRCQVLEQYSRFVSAVRAAGGNGELTDHKMKALMDNCIEAGILPDFLREHGREAVNMLFEELTYEEDMEMCRADGYKRGKAEGHAEGHAEGREKGRVEAYSQLNKLNQYLIAENRFEDLKKATTDTEYQHHLLEEYRLLTE